MTVAHLGRAYGVLTYTPTIQSKLGIVYLDRNKIKLLPAGGVIYTPNADNHFDILFPNPKLSHRLTTVGTTNYWAYVAAEYGGGAWEITRDNGSHDNFDYNDIRVFGGLESIPETRSGLPGFIEIGYSFERQLIYTSNNPTKFEPSNTIQFASGFAF